MTRQTQKSGKVIKPIFADLVTFCLFTRVKSLIAFLENKSYSMGVIYNLPGENDFINKFFTI